MPPTVERMEIRVMSRMMPRSEATAKRLHSHRAISDLRRQAQYIIKHWQVLASTAACPTARVTRFERQPKLEESRKPALDINGEEPVWPSVGSQARNGSRLLPARRWKKLATGTPLRFTRRAPVAKSSNGIRLLSRQARRYTFW